MPALNAACGRAASPAKSATALWMSVRASISARPTCGAATSGNRSRYSRITWPGSMARCDTSGSAPPGPARSCGWACWELLTAVWATSRQRSIPHERRVSSPTRFSGLLTLLWRIGGRASSGRTRAMCPWLCNTWSMVSRFAARARSIIWFRSSRHRWATPMRWRDAPAEGITLLTKALGFYSRQQVHLWGSLVERVPGFCQSARQ